MKILVTYYSRTGTTKIVGDGLAKALDADVDEIIDQTARLGWINYMRSARAAKNRKLTKITTDKQPEDYDLILIGTPIWWDHLTPAVRTYLKHHPLNGKKVVFFITSDGEECEMVLNQLRELTPDCQEVGFLHLLKKTVQKNGYQERIEAFARTLRAIN